MIITAITEQKKNRGRMNLFVDNHFYASVSSRIAEKGLIYIGQEIDKIQLEKIIFESDKSVAFDYACNYIGKYYCTEKKIREKLFERGYGSIVVNYAVEKLKDYKLIDDRRFAADYYECKKSTCGLKKIVNDLIIKGVKKEDIAILYELESGDKNCELEAALKLAKNHSKGNTIDMKYLARLGRYLGGKGFEWSIVKECIDRIKDEKDFD